MAAEKIFENKVKAFLKQEGAWFLKYWGGGEFTKSGVPDILACVNGVFLAIEVKSPIGRPSKLQLFTIEEIKKSGGVALVLYPKDFEKFKTLVKTIKQHQTKDFSRVWDLHAIIERENGNTI